MQKDMHFYGTYAMARAAGIPQQDSQVIAYAAQFIDDSTAQNSTSHEDGAVINNAGEKKKRVEQWRKAIKSNKLFKAEDGDVSITYDHNEWEREKEEFHHKNYSLDGLNTHIYHFHQGAALHRYYVLKDLLPKLWYRGLLTVDTPQYKGI